MVQIENECVGCPPNMGCLGDSCPNRNVPHYYCDECGEELSEIYECDGSQFCKDCLFDVMGVTVIYV